MLQELAAIQLDRQQAQRLLMTKAQYLLVQQVCGLRKKGY